jgi:preprotein translocase SecE subunit
VDRIRRLFSRFRRFVDEDWSELKKVSWPTIPQTRNLTVLVIAVSFAVGLFITVFDAIFLEALKLVGTG